ncbi:ATP cone domain-containing protein, partial [Ralstonia pseudosolanacearum]|uniref:ATP cone domain-containing protein n=1 Tax=Ralstonia pseudosolanacearum TaxID=1310165 RepID=UPI003D16428D
VGKFFNSELEVENVINRVIDSLYGLGTDEVQSKQIGEAVLDVLAEINEVAYVRFASVFQEFKTLDDFEEILKEQKKKRNK